MTIVRTLLVLGLVVAVPLAAPRASADEPKAEPAAASVGPRIATQEEADAALDRFKEEYRARGLKGQEKLSQRDFAMENLCAVQHPDIAKELGKIARGRDDMLRLLAVIYLGEQKEIPGIAGPEILKALKRYGKKDETFAIWALDSLGRLRYLGAMEELEDLLNHNDFAVKKAAIQAIGRIGDVRLWKEVLKLAGVTVKEGDSDAGVDQSGGKEEVVDEGYSYEGVEVTYDTGTSGDGDQKMAEKIGKEKLAANKAAAMAGRSGGVGGGGGSGGGTATRGGVARNPKELLPAVLEALYYLTGERFNNSKEVAEWVRENRERIAEKVEVIEALAKAQEEEADQLD